MNLYAIVNFVLYIFIKSNILLNEFFMCTHQIIVCTVRIGTCLKNIKYLYVCDYGKKMIHKKKI